MKRVLIFAIAIFALAFSVSNATWTRTLTMGDANMILHDDANIWIFPSTLYDYPELVMGEFVFSGWWGPSKAADDGYGFYNIGAHYKFSEKNPYVLGVYFTRNQPYNIWNYPVDFTYQNNRKIDLFYSRMLGGHKFGFFFDYVNGSQKYETDSTAYTSRDQREWGVTQYTFNFGLTPNNGKLDLSAGISLLSWTHKYYNGEDITKPDGNLSFGVAARYFYEYSQKMTFVPHLSFSSEKVGIKWYEQGGAPYYDTLYQTRTSKDMDLEVGCGLNYTPAAGILAIGDFGICFGKTTYEYDYSDPADTDLKDKYSDIAVPYFRIGLEATVFNWMDVRFGGTSYWQRDKTDNEHIGTDFNYVYKYRYNYVSNETYLGAGFHWGNLFIDSWINPDIVTGGLNFVNGYSEPLSWMASVKYKMF